MKKRTQRLLQKRASGGATLIRRHAEHATSTIPRAKARYC